MGFTNLQAQLLYCPPYLYAPIPAITTALIADRFHQRALAITINCVLVIIGTCLYTQIDKLGVRYLGIFLAVGSANSNVPLIVSWSQTSIRSQSKRGFTSALVIAMGGLGGIIASVAFKNNEAPKYPTGVYLTLATHTLMIILALSLKFWMHMKNKRADRGETIIEGNPKFRYQA
jgi:dipeptide/tripeptide permease